MSASRRAGLPADHPARAPYRDRSTAAAYATRRFQAGSGPATDRREREALEFLLEATGLRPGATVLDCPAGGGRLAGLLAARGFRVVAADQSPAMLAHAVPALRGAGLPARVVAADALRLPFRDGAFDLVLCHRLFHHMARPEERAALLRSLRSASRRWVLVSWFDAFSLQHVRRALRRPFRGSGRHAVAGSRFRREAAAAGLFPAAERALRPLVSELRLTLMEVRS